MTHCDLCSRERWPGQQGPVRTWGGLRADLCQSVRLAATQGRLETRSSSSSRRWGLGRPEGHHAQARRPPARHGGEGKGGRRRDALARRGFGAREWWAAGRRPNCAGVDVWFLFSSGLFFRSGWESCSWFFLGRGRLAEAGSCSCLHGSASHLLA